jgi:SAM-dependent methyltransferase
MTLPGSYFDDLYATAADPWGFADRWYEDRKRALSLALLPDRRYATAYEPGCSIGVLTAALATRCGHLLATDISASAIRSARARCAHLPGVTVEQATLPADWPSRAFDLVVLSELCYYFDATDARTVAERAAGSARTLLAVHWRHKVQDYPRDGDAAHASVARAAAAFDLRRVGEYRDDDIVAAVWAVDGRSVAERGGLT